MSETTTDLLRGELERLFELDEMTALSLELMGYPPTDLGEPDGKGAFARALVDRCAEDDALEALADAMTLFGKAARTAQIFESRAGRALEPGEEIDGFRIRKSLEGGGLGDVYLAEKGEGDDKVRVALKLIRSSLSRDPSAVARFLTGQRGFGRAEIAGIAQVHGCGKLQDGRPWVATEYVDGQTLASRIARVGPMHFNEARPVFKGVLSALHELHERGLVHADVKSANVFVVRPTAEDGTRQEPTGVLVDGGAHRLLAAGAKHPDAIGALRVFGNAQAVAPEMALGGRINASSDIYAVGVMLYEVLTGKFPFTGDTAFEVIAKHIDTPPTPPSEVAPKGWVSKDVDALVLRALAKDPAERFANAKELLSALDALTKAKKEKDLDADELAKAAEALEKDLGDAEKANAVDAIIAPSLAWDEGIEVFSKCAEKAEDAEVKKGLFFRVARIQAVEKGDKAAAEETYRKILEVDADDAIARSGLEELKREAGDHEGLAELLLERAETMADPVERAEVLREIARLYETKLEDPDNALVAWTQAIADDPSEAQAARAIERIADKNADAWNEVLSTLSEVVQELGDVPDAVPLYCLMGRWYGDALKRPDFALPCFGKAIEIDPQCDEAYEGSLGLYRSAQSWPEVVQVLEARANATSNPAAARDHRAAAADVVLRKVGDQDRAVSMLEAILDEDPGHPGALESLIAIHEQRKEWKSLAKLLARKVSHQSGDAKTADTLRLAELYEDRLDDFEQAIVHYEAAFAQDAGSLAALKGLERVYARGNDYPKLLDTLERQLTLIATPRQRIAVLEHIGAIQEEEFVDPEAAIAAYEQVVEIDPGNENANPALARLYRQKGRFDELVACLERHAQATEDLQRKTDLLLSAAKTLMLDVGAPERAMQFTERVLAADAKHADALTLLARLKAQSGDASAAVAAVDQLADAESDASKKAEHLIEAGKLLEAAGDHDQAIERFKRALDADEKNIAAAEALRRLYAKRGDAHGAAELLQREIDTVEGKLKKAELQAELGVLYRDRLDDKDKAHQAFSAALDLDGTCTAASLGLGQMAFANGDFEAASKHLEPLLARTEKMEKDEARDLSVMCGDAFRELGDFAKAQRAYLNAKAYAPDDREVLQRVADVTFDAGEADEAAELYREMLEKLGGSLDAEVRGRILLRRGEALRRAGELDEAAKLLDQAAEIRLEDPAPLDSLRKVYEAKEEWDQVVRTMRRRMEHAGDAERFDLLVSVGDVLSGKLKDREKAAKSYVAALEITPDDRNLLTKLMGVYSETKDWSKLVEIILRIAELVDDKGQLSKYYLTAASIAHAELQRHDEAADYYEQALENDPTSKRAFEGLVACLEHEKSWSSLAKAYRAHIDRSKGAPAEDRAAIWDKLGELYQEKLDDLASAIEAYEAAQDLDPDGRRRLELLAGIYEENPKRYFRKAIEAHTRLLEKSPYRIESYQALRQLYTDVKKPDQSWCVCQTLRVLSMAGAEEKDFFEKHRSRHPAAAQEFFNEDIWFNHLIHPEQGPLLTGIFAAITPAVVKSKGQPLSAYKVAEGEARDPESDGSEMVQTLNYVAGVTQIALPKVYYRQDDPGGLSLLYADPPAIGVGKAALAGGPAQALAFLAARHLSYFRPGHYLRHFVPSGSGLRAWLLAAIKLGTPQFPVPGNLGKKVDKALASLKEHLSAGDKQKVGALVQKLLAAAPELDMKRWVAAVDFTADRVGFVMANDLELATAVVKASPDDGTQKERLKELYLYSVSEAYMQLRQKLGLTIDS